MTHARVKKQWQLTSDHTLLIALIILPFIWYFREIFTDTCLFVDDLSAQYRPWWEYARNRLLQGEFPFWNPYVFCGMPYHTNPENFMFYPLKIPLTLLPYFKGAALLRALNSIVASTGMFYFLRHYRIGALAASAGAIMFTYGSFMSCEFIHMPYINVVCWLPWELLTLKRLFERPCVNRAGIFSVVTATSFLGGSPGVFAITQIMVGFVAFFLILKPLFQHKWNRIKRTFIFLVISILLFTALTAILLFPVLQFIPFSPRSEGLQQLDSYIKFSIDPFLLKLLAVPLIHWMNGAPYPPIHPMLVIFIPYTGILGFLLTVLGLFSRGGQALRSALLVCFILGIMLALGKNTAFFPFLYHRLEFIRYFRWPHDYLLMTYISQCILAAFGLNILFRNRLLKRHGAILTAVLVFIAIDLYIFGLGYRVTAPKINLNMAHVKPSIDFLSKYADYERVSVVTGYGNHHFWGQQYFFQSLPSLSGDPDWMESKLPKSDVWCAERDSSSWYSYYRYRAQLFQNWTSWSRSYPINSAMRFGYQELCGYNPFMLERINALLRAQPIENIWNLCNVRFIATTVDLSKIGWRRVFPNEYMHIYETPSRVPRAFIPLRVKDHLEADAIYLQMQNDSFNPTACSYIEQTLDKPLAPLLAKDIPEAPVIQSYTPERVVIRTDVKSGALLVLNDAYYPAWKVFIDGVEQPVLRVNYAFRAVKLPPGRHTILWVYRPTLFYVSATVTAITWVAFLFLGLRHLLKRKGTKHVR
jgi:hypothetical protein